MKRYEVLASANVGSPYDSFAIKFGNTLDELDKARAYRDNLKEAGLRAELRKVEKIE